MCNRAAFHLEANNSNSRDCRRRTDRRLRVGIPFCVHPPIGVSESQATENNVAHQGTRLRISLQRHQPFKRRRNHNCPCHIFAGDWHVRNRMLRPIQIPFPLSIQSVGRVLNVIARICFLVRRAWVGTKRGDVIRFIHLQNRHANIRPRKKSNYFNIAPVRPFLLDIVAAVMKLKRLVLRVRSIRAKEPIVWRTRPCGSTPIHK